MTQQTEIRNDLDQDVDQRARRPEKEDDVHPDRLGTATHEVNDGKRLEQDAPRVHE